MDARALRHRLVFAPLKAKRLWVLEIVAALGLMGLAQGAFVALVGPFFKALFMTTGVGTVQLADVVPAGLVSVWPSLSDISFDGDKLVIWVPVSIFIVGAIRSVARYVFQMRQATLGLYIAKVYREFLFAKVLGQNYLTLAAKTPAEWMSQIMNDVLFLQSRFSEIAGSLLRDVVLVTACLIALIFVHWPSALALLLCSPVLAFGLGKVGKRIGRYADWWQRELAKLAASVLDFRERFDFIRASHAEEAELRRFEVMNRRYYRSIRKSILIRSAFAPGLEFIGFMVFAVFLLLIGRGYFGVDFRGEILLQFFAAVGLALRPLRNLGEQLGRYNETLGSLKQSLEVLSQVEGHGETTGATKEFNGLSIHSAGVQIPGADVALSLQDLTFAKGSSVAIVGASGSGKSTLLRVLTGLVVPEQWEANLHWSELSSHTSLVSQAPFLFDDSLRDNLTYGLSSRRSDGDINAALEFVGIAAEVETLTLGLNTRYRALAKNFSGGQIQRLVIARALLRQRPVLVFDEATSAVAATAEGEITSKVLHECRESGWTFISATHRMQWLPKYDEVLYMEAGRVVLRGRHADLLRDARYAAFVGS